MNMCKSIGRRDLGRVVAARVSLSFALLAAVTSGAGTAAVTDQELRAKAEEAWHQTWDRFYDEHTNLFYDRICSHNRPQRWKFLPTPDEIARQFPNRNGWGTGMEDCAISGGVLMSMICDRFAATGDEALRPAAQKVFAGLVLLGSLSPSEGFVIRGVCPADGHSYYSESSRDQYTWYAYALWRYCRSPLSTEADKARARELITSVCNRLHRNVVAEHDYRIGRADGTFDTLVDKMWENAAHEVARLPMIYAIGADLTGDARWREEAARYAAAAAERSAAESTKIPYALLQQQVSLEALHELEESPVLKARWLECMRLVAQRAEAPLQYGRGYQVQELEKMNLDWRTWPAGNAMGYRVPLMPDTCKREDRTVRQPAEGALVQLLLPKPELTPEQVALVKQAIAQVDYARAITYGLYYTQAVYWRAVRTGVFTLPGK